MSAYVNAREFVDPAMRIDPELVALVQAALLNAAGAVWTWSGPKDAARRFSDLGPAGR
jgi:hypothetical protein